MNEFEDTTEQVYSLSILYRAINPCPKLASHAKQFEFLVDWQDIVSWFMVDRDRVDVPIKLLTDDV